MMDCGVYDLLLQFGSTEATEDIELDRLARRFNLELQREGLAAELVPTSPIVATRSTAGAAIGTVAVKLAPSLLSGLIERIKEFLARSHNRTIKVKVQLGKNVVEIEYSADKALSTKDVSYLVRTLTESVS
jgi:hypothetical protein